MSMASEARQGKRASSVFTNGQALKADANEVMKAAALLFHSGEPHEIRAIMATGKTRSALAWAGDARKLLATVEAFGAAKGIYFTLSPVPRGVAAKIARGEAAGDVDVAERFNILIDVDASRPADTNATAEEKASALDLADEIRDFLASEFEFPEPASGDSGNGGHLTYRTALPNDESTKDLIRRFLVALAKKFDTARAGVDRSVYNASRITKLPGTVVRKGPHSDERPHRVARILHAPAELMPVTREQLEAVVAALGGWDDVKTEPTNGTVRKATCAADVEERARAYARKIDPAISGQGGHDKTFYAACKVGPGFGLPRDLAIRILAEEYNPRCEPPWSQKDLERKVDEAYKKEPHRGFLLDAGKPGTNGHIKGAKPSANGHAEPKPIIEAPDDPFRLARLHLENYQHSDGLTLRFYRGEFWNWDSAWRVKTGEEVNAQLAKTCKAEFDRLNQTTEGKPKKVSCGTVGNTTMALKSLTLLEGKVEAPCWLSSSAPFPPDEILPARNALVHLPSLAEGKAAGIWKPTPTYFGTFALNYDYDPAADAPVEWFRFLGSLWDNDPQSIETLQEWFGYCLTADTRQQKILSLIGPKRAGKDTIARVLRAMVGAENVAGPTLTSLASQFGCSSLIGKPLAIVSDARLSGRTDAAVIVERLLTISGEGTLDIDRKHLPPWTGKLPTRFVLISNELPRLHDSSGALAGRLVLLSLTRSFFGKEDKTLFDRLTRELPGILLWAIEGWKRLRERGHFVQPDSGQELVDEMEDLASPVGTFLRERCDVQAGHEIDTKDLYREWRSWCESAGRKEPGDEQNFGRNLRAVLPALKTRQTRREGSVVRLYVGLDLKSVF